MPDIVRRVAKRLSAIFRVSSREMTAIVVVVALLVSAEYAYRIKVRRTVAKAAREAEATERRRAAENAIALTISKEKAVTRVQNVAAKFCRASTGEEHPDWGAYRDLQNACDWVGRFEHGAASCVSFQALLAAVTKVDAVLGRIATEIDGIVIPATPPAPEYEPPPYEGAFFLSGALRHEYGGEGILLEQGGRYFVVENGTPVDPLTSWIRTYVDPTGRTTHIDIGRFGRDAQVVRISSRETYLDDRQTYQQALSRALTEFREARAAYSALIAATKERQTQARKRQAALRSERDAQLEERNHALSTESTRLFEKGVCKSELTAPTRTAEGKASNPRDSVPRAEARPSIAGEARESPPKPVQPAQEHAEPGVKPIRWVDPFEERHSDAPKARPWVDPFAE